MTPNPTVDRAQYRQSIFSIPKMDCPSEESLVRIALGDVEKIHSLSFDLDKRELTAVHQGDPGTVLSRLQPMKLGAVLRDSVSISVTEAPPSSTTAHWESTFAVPQMDCPSEENLIRMTLSDLDEVTSLSFDLSKRQLQLTHQGAAESVLAQLQPLKLGAVLVESIPVTLPPDQPVDDSEGNAAEAKTLRLLLAINGAMFFIELALGLIAQSTALIADSLDMFADAAVYGLALYAVGRAASLKIRAAHMAGWLQLALALGALSEVVRRFLFGSEPESALMMGVGLVALAANVTCLVLIARKRDRGAHMKASYIFSANDVLANLGVIAAGALVAWTRSPYPDLIIGTVIGLIVMNGARRILKLR